MTSRSQRGQGLIEFCSLLLPLTLFFSLTLLTIYVCFSHFWIRHHLYNGVICLIEENSQKHCKEKTFSHLKDLIPWGSLSHLQLSMIGQPTRGYATGKIKYHLSHHWKKSPTLLQYQIKILLPLKTRESY